MKRPRMEPVREVDGDKTRGELRRPSEGDGVLISGRHNQRFLPPFRVWQADPSRPERHKPMLFMLVAGVFCMVAPTWIICACGMGDLEDEDWLQWLVRIVGLVFVGAAAYFTFIKH